MKNFGIHTSRRKLKTEFSFFLSTEIAHWVPIFTNDLQWDEKSALHSKHIFIPLKERTIFSQHDARSGCYVTSVVCAVEVTVVVCAIRVSFFAFFSWDEEMEEERKSFRGAPKKGFLGRKWNYLWVRRIASQSDRNLWLTQKSKFIKTTKNLTIEQQAFIVNLFSFFSSSQTIHNFFFAQKFSFIITKISSPHDRPLLNFLFYKLTFSLPLRQTIRVANRMMQMFTSDWGGKMNAQRQNEKHRRELRAHMRTTSVSWTFSVK